VHEQKVSVSMKIIFVSPPHHSSFAKSQCFYVLFITRVKYLHQTKVANRTFVDSDILFDKNKNQTLTNILITRSCSLGYWIYPNDLICFKVTHQVCIFRDGCKQGIDQQMFNRKSISRKITHPQSWKLQAKLAGEKLKGWSNSRTKTNSRLQSKFRNRSS